MSQKRFRENFVGNFVEIPSVPVTVDKVRDKVSDQGSISRFVGQPWLIAVLIAFLLRLLLLLQAGAILFLEKTNRLVNEYAAHAQHDHGHACAPDHLAPARARNILERIKKYRGRG